VSYVPHFMGLPGKPKGFDGSEEARSSGVAHKQPQSSPGAIPDCGKGLLMVVNQPLIEQGYRIWKSCAQPYLIEVGWRTKKMAS